MTSDRMVAFLGPPGTFSEQAATNYFAPGWTAMPCSTIEDVFIAIDEGAASHAVVPVENSTEGVVNNTQDCMVATRACIVGEEIVSIDHHLLTGPDTKPGEIRQIASHPQSLAQCRKWLRAEQPETPIIECRSNAEAARLAAEQAGTAAIAGDLAAQTYGLTRTVTSIQDHRHNSTRFLIFARESTRSTGRDKTSVLIYAANRPGALFHVLEPFEQLQVSLTKIDSRPAKKAAWEYVFFIDFEGHVEDANIKELFSRLQSCTEDIKVLGSYPAANGERG